MSQNLIQNPSFEDYVHCPERLSNFDKDVESWSIPTLGSTDYFNGCSATMGTPKNFKGSQPADFGQGYAGLYAYAPENYREYIQAELTKTLVKGKKYQVSFYVSLAERSDYAIKEFGVLFSNKAMVISTKRELSKGQLYRNKDNTYNYLEIGYTNFYSDTQDWILVNTQFVAKGTEKYMTIGNFKNNAGTRRFRTKRDTRQGAYYYVDMVLVATVEENDMVNSSKKRTETFELNKTHTFDHILFAFDNFQLLQTAKKEMRVLFDHLQKDTTLHIEINGHTDSVGSSTYNQVLSSRRARAVADYLQKLGLTPDRVNWQGYGGTKPVATNATDNGRRQNRRVEFVISKKTTIKKGI